MGVDISTHRIRIGCFCHNVGNDVVMVLVTFDVNMTFTRLWTSLLVALGVVTLLNLVMYGILINIHFMERGQTMAAMSYTFWQLCVENCRIVDSIVGAVWYINLLLLSATIKPIPGPEFAGKTIDLKCPWLQINTGLAIFLTTFLTSLLSRIGIKEVVKNPELLCSCETDRIMPHNSVPYVSYLLGNKGAHMVNGNHHDKGDVVLTADALSLLNNGVSYSVGVITINEKSYGKFYPCCTGTGFRVGKSYIMSVFHLFRNNIDGLLDNIIHHAPKISPDLLKNLELNEIDTDITTEDAIRRFNDNNAFDIPLLLKRLGSTVKERVSSHMDDQWDCTIKFGNNEIFKLGWHILFGHKTSDIVILPLIQNTLGQTIPKPLFLVENFDKQTKHVIIRNITEENPMTILDDNCSLYLDDAKLKRDVEYAVDYWHNQDNTHAKSRWKSEFQDDVYKQSYTECSKAHNEETGVVIMKAADSFKFGSSGSPIVYLKSGDPFVGILYQGGVPAFYYKNEDKYKEIDKKVLFQKGTTMKKFGELLTLYHKTDLKRDIFKPYGGFMERTENQWKKDEETFIETTASKHICREIERSNILTIVGTAGSGKSSCMHHVAITLQRQGYSLFIVRDCYEIEQFIELCSEKPLFLVDDPIGEDNISQEKLMEWRNRSVQLQSFFTGTIKLMVTIRKELINSLEDSNIFTNNKIIDLHYSDLEMTQEERKTYFENICSKRGTDVPVNDPVFKMVTHCDFRNFPSLVHMYTCSNDKYFQKHPHDLFVEPYGVFKTLLNKMWECNSEQFGGLVLCAVYQDKLPIEVFDLCDPKFSHENRNAEVVLQNLSIQCSLDSVGKEIEKLQGVYIHKTKSSFSFLHSAFINIVLYVVAEKDDHERVVAILDYCDIEFCIDRLRLSRNTFERHLPIYRKIGDKYRIPIPEDIEDSLASKFIMSFKTSNNLIVKIFTSSFCHNAQFLEHILKAIEKHLKDDQFRLKILYQVFCNACLIDAIEIRDKLKTLFKEFSSPCFSGLTPLIACSFADDINQIEEFLAHECNVNVLGTGCYATTPLYVAVSRNNIQLAKLYLKNHADTLLGDACAKGLLDIIHFLLNHGANINKQDGMGRSPITRAVLEHQFEVVKTLLNHKADVNQCGDNNRSITPLGAACQVGNVDLIYLLFNHGADINALDGTGRSPLSRAITRCGVDIVKLLLDLNANVNLCDDVEQSVTPLGVACDKGCTDVIRLLLNRGADINRLDGLGRTPITQAVLKHHTEVVQILLDNNADVNLCGETNESLTPLGAASQKGYLDITKLLIKHNENITKLDEGGRRAIDHAVQRNHLHMVNCLKQNNYSCICSIL